MGIVRKRDIETHKSRLDFVKYQTDVNRNNGDSNLFYAVLGEPIFQALVSQIIDANGGR